MRLLRADADAVMFGEDTFRNAPGHMWTAGCMYPPFEREFHAFRKHVCKDSFHPLNVVVSGMDQVDLDQPLFRREEIRRLVLTTEQGVARFQQRYAATLAGRRPRASGQSHDRSIRYGGIAPSGVWGEAAPS